MTSTTFTRDQVTAFLVEYYTAMETNDPAKYSAYYADDLTLTFGNADPIHGREAAVEAFDSVLRRFTSLAHDLVNVWPQSDGVVIFESIGTWHLRTGESVSVPACSIFTIVDELFTEMRIYVDNADVFAALERAEQD